MAPLPLGWRLLLLCLAVLVKSKPTAQGQSCTSPSECSTLVAKKELDMLTWVPPKFDNRTLVCAENLLLLLAQFPPFDGDRGLLMIKSFGTWRFHDPWEVGC